MNEEVRSYFGILYFMIDLLNIFPKSLVLNSVCSIVWGATLHYTYILLLYTISCSVFTLCGLIYAEQEDQKKRCFPTCLSNHPSSKKHSHGGIPRLSPR